MGDTARGPDGLESVAVRAAAHAEGLARRPHVVPQRPAVWLRRRMGGPEGVARQHAQGRLTVRERIDLLGEQLQELFDIIYQGVKDLA